MIADDRRHLMLIIIFFILGVSKKIWIYVWPSLAYSVASEIFKKPIDCVNYCPMSFARPNFQIHSYIIITHYLSFSSHNFQNRNSKTLILLAIPTSIFYHVCWRYCTYFWYSSLTLLLLPFLDGSPEPIAAHLLFSRLMLFTKLMDLPKPGLLIYLPPFHHRLGWRRRARKFSHGPKLQ